MKSETMLRTLRRTISNRNELKTSAMKEENHIQAGFDDQQEQKPAEFFHHSFHIESNINYYDKDEKNIS